MLTVAPLILATILTFQQGEDEFKQLKTNIARVKPPSAVKEEDLTFKSGEVTIAATLFLPTGDSKVGAVVMTHGSDKTGRRSRFFRLWGKVFASNGIAVLIYDKRGVGDSGGEYVETPNFDIAASDVVAAAELLAKRPDIDPARIGVMGPSQAGWVAPMAASKSPHLSFVVVVSGTPVPPIEQGYFYHGNLMREAGLTEAEVVAAVDLMRKSSKYVATGAGYEALKADFAKAEAEPWFEKVKAMIIPPLVPPSALDHPLLALFKDSKRMLYDPIPVLSSLKVPVLWVFGEKDNNVNVAESKAILDGLAKEKGLKVEVQVFPGANHGILVPGEKGVWTYAPGYFDSVIEWVKARTATRLAANR